MPELPEVETYARDLAAVLPGCVLSGARVAWTNQLPRNTADELDRRVRGQEVVSVGRRGKYLVLRLTEDWLLVHLKMSGRLQLAPPDTPPNPYVHVIFQLADRGELRFHDPRKFGRVYLLADPDVVLGRLGPEPLDDELTLARFGSLLAARRGRLKPLLLNQAFLVGLGNIYTDESLWASRLHPLRTAGFLDARDVARLYAAIRDVLRRAIQARGTTFTAGGYRDLSGNPGEMQGTLAVFGRTGQPCLRCGAAIVRLVVAGRGTHICPSCQPRP